MSAGLLGRTPQSGLGDRFGYGGGLFGLGALLDQGERDVGICVFLVGADELPEIDFVGDRDLGFRSPLLGGLLRLLLLFLLALGRAAFRRGRRSDASGGSSARAGERRPPAWTPRLAGPRRTAAHGTSAWSAGCWMINGGGRRARAEPCRAGRRARARGGRRGSRGPRLHLSCRCADGGAPGRDRPGRQHNLARERFRSHRLRLGRHNRRARRLGRLRPGFRRGFRLRPRAFHRRLRALRFLLGWSLGGNERLFHDLDARQGALLRTECLGLGVADDELLGRVRLALEDREDGCFVQRGLG